MAAMLTIGLVLLTVLFVFSLAAVLPEQRRFEDEERASLEARIGTLTEALGDSDEHLRAKIKLEEQATEHMARMFARVGHRS